MSAELVYFLVNVYSTGRLLYIEASWLALQKRALAFNAAGDVTDVMMIDVTTV